MWWWRDRPIDPGDGWTEHLDSAGNVYFRNALTEVATYDHPLDEHYRSYYLRARVGRRAVYSHHHNYVVYWYTKHPGPIVYSHHHHHHVNIVYWYTKHQGPIVYSHGAAVAGPSIHTTTITRLNSSVLYRPRPIKSTAFPSFRP